MSINLLTYLLLASMLVLTGCRNKTENTFKQKMSFVRDSLNLETDTIAEPAEVVKVKKEVKIYGDTVWVHSYASTVWYDSLIYDDFEVYMSVWVDTTDYIIDTAVSSKGSRIVIGYNHHYNLRFLKHGNHWFSAVFDKKSDLKDMLENTDFWLESNMDVFQNIYYNELYDKIIFDYAVNPRYNYGATYYFIMKPIGEIEYSGIGNSWGGGDPDGEAFLSGDEEMFVTAYELYSFKNHDFIDVSKLSFIPNAGSSDDGHTHLTNIHAYKPLTDSSFLMIFNRPDIASEYNAYVISTDTVILAKFRYYGLMEEIDAILFFEYNDDLNAYFLYDTERKALISISDSTEFSVNEQLIKNASVIQSDTLTEEHDLNIVSFEDFGSYVFYLGANDSLMYYEIESFE